MEKCEGNYDADNLEACEITINFAIYYGNFLTSAMRELVLYTWYTLNLPCMHTLTDIIFDVLGYLLDLISLIHKNWTQKLMLKGLTHTQWIPVKQIFL